ncbi:hypothetical protein Sjap_003512 [Stephania japonica]|uniref:Uncharacterized protein n=1 Tax=Stephania japonica TaxID=461633 RepID=A0AAP0KQZ6_9MAGN
MYRGATPELYLPKEPIQSYTKNHQSRHGNQRFPSTSPSNPTKPSKNRLEKCGSSVDFESNFGISQVFSID